MSKNRSLRQLLTRYFEPLIFDPLVSVKAILPAVLNWLIWSVILFLIKNITNSISSQSNEYLLEYTLAFVGLSVLYQCVIVVTRNRTHVKFRPYWRQYFYKKYMTKFLYLDATQTEKMWTWRLVSILNSWFHTHISQIASFVLDVIPSFVQILVSIVFIFMLQVSYWLIVVFLLVVLWYLIYYQQKKANVLRKVRNELNVWIMRNFVKILMSKFEVLSANRASYEISKLTTSLDTNLQINIKQMNYTVWVDIWVRLFVDVFTLLIILLFWFGLFDQVLNVWEFASLIWIVYFLDKSFSQLISYYVVFLKNNVEIIKLRDTFDEIPEMKHVDTWLDYVYKTWSFVLQNISFGYDEVSPVFTNLNLTIQWGKKLALVWDSWWWKSTLLKLLACYLEPDSWKILIDWQDMSTLKKTSYYNKIGYLKQDPSIFDWTVLENLTYALSHIPTQKEIDTIIKLARCEFIFSFADWLDTEIWERWVRLSWWQKQRLAIAKIMFKNPSLIFLDEPTSALDSINEEYVSEAMHNLFVWKTVVVVAHRLQTVKEASKILFIQSWKIVEEWTHQELIAKNWEYKRMLDMQTKF